MKLTNNDYTVGWISALPVETAAARAMMDKPLHSPLPQAPQDTNSYTLGRIGPHNVVIACLPGTGTNTAAHAAANLVRSFPNVRFGLMVGIGGGVPGLPNANSSVDVRLGDVVVSSPGDQHGGVIQYDFGTAVQEGERQRFVRKGHLNKPPSILLGAIRALQASSKLEESQFLRHYKEMLEKYPLMEMEYFKPDTDMLFASTYQHQSGGVDCSFCADGQIQVRQPRKDSIVHYGLIASANRVLRDAFERDRLHADEGIICFEMEAAGLMDEFSCVVIRGICDYCDSHKSKLWQPYASAVAAAYAKELLLMVPRTAVVTLPHLADLATIGTTVSGVLRECLADVTREQLQKTNEALSKINTKLYAIDSAADPKEHLKCLDNLRCLHPRYDKKRLEETKGGLLRDAYKWILQNQEFMAWRASNGLLWIKGDPGKGKTMLMCGVIDELDNCPAYFFCQATVNTNNTSTWVIRGLIYSILDQYPDLSGSVYDKVQRASDLPHETAFYVLAEVLEELLAVQDMVILVDALDECLEGLDQLLRFIVKASNTYTSSWLVSSRNILAIGEHLEEATRLSLELNDTSVANAVRVFIIYKVQELSRAKNYDTALRDMVLQHLLSNAQGTFLWVSLVCLSLARVRLRHTKAALAEYPSGLDSIYLHMLESIAKSTDANTLQQVLGIACVVFRPLSLAELSAFILPADHDGNNDGEDTTLWIEDLVNDCGCFFSIRDSVVEFIHQSAKDFLVSPRAKQTFFTSMVTLHDHAFIHSINSLEGLRRNMYSLTEPGKKIEDVTTPSPDPLAKMRYASIYWIDHILESIKFTFVPGISIVHARMILKFMRTKYLYWLEALSLLGGIYPAVLALSKLHTQLQQSKSLIEEPLLSEFNDAIAITFDALQFIRYFQYALIRFPMQTYISGLLFSPRLSLIKYWFRNEVPEWATITRGLQDSWPRSLSLDHRCVERMRWSRSGEYIACYDRFHNVRIWNSSSGELVASTKGEPKDFTFSTDEHKLMMISHPNSQIVLWSFREDQYIATIGLRGPEALSDKLSPPDGIMYSSCGGYAFPSVVFSQDSSLVALATKDPSGIKINCTNSGAVVQNLIINDARTDLVFSSDNKLLAGVAPYEVLVWTVQTGNLTFRVSAPTSLQSLKVAFSPCSRLLAITNEDIELWDWKNQRKMHSTENRRQSQDELLSRQVVFRPKTSTMFVCHGRLLEEWSVQPLAGLRICEILQTEFLDLAISEDGRKVAVSDMNSVKILQPDKETIDLPISDDILRAQELAIFRLYNDKVYLVEQFPTCQVHVWPKSQHGVGRTVLTSDLDPYAEFHLSPDASSLLVFVYGKEFFEYWSLVEGSETRRRIAAGFSFERMGWGPAKDEITIQYSHTQVLGSWSFTDTQDVVRPRAPWEKVGYASRHSTSCWSPSNTRLVVAENDELYLWDHQNHSWALLMHKIPLSLDSTTGIGKFSEDSKTFVNICKAGTLRVFRVEKPELILVIQQYGQSSTVLIDNQWLITDRARHLLPQQEEPHNHTGWNTLELSGKLNLKTFYSNEGSWIRSEIDNIIWLPSAYRPVPSNFTQHYDIEGPTVAIYLGVNQVMTMKVHWDRSKGLASKSSSTESRKATNSHKRRRSSQENRQLRTPTQWHVE